MDTAHAAKGAGGEGGSGEGGGGEGGGDEGQGDGDAAEVTAEVTKMVRTQAAAVRVRTRVAMRRREGDGGEGKGKGEGGDGGGGGGAALDPPGSPCRPGGEHGGETRRLHGFWKNDQRAPKIGVARAPASSGSRSYFEILFPYSLTPLLPSSEGVPPGLSPPQEGNFSDLTGIREEEEMKGNKK